MAEPTEANLPFGMGSIDFTQPVQAGLAIVALVFGFAVFHMTDTVGSTLASMVNNFISNATGANVAGGQDGPDLI